MRRCVRARGLDYQGIGALAPRPGPRTTALPKKRAVAKWKPRKLGIAVFVEGSITGTRATVAAMAVLAERAGEFVGGAVDVRLEGIKPVAPDNVG